MSDGMRPLGDGALAGIERQAGRAGEALARAVAADEGARAALQEVAAALFALQAAEAEWAALHRLIRGVLDGLAPFRSLLVPRGGDGLGAAGRQALLHNWRPCQRSVDGLVGFAEEVQHIGRPFRREGRRLEGERWAVDVVSLQLLLEDALKEDEPDPASMVELAEELDSACRRHLALAERELRNAVERVRRLCASLMGGWV
jgi:hypothetical protein